METQTTIRKRKAQWWVANRFTVAYRVKATQRKTQTLFAKLEERTFKTNAEAQAFVMRNRKRWDWHVVRVTNSLIGR